LVDKYSPLVYLKEVTTGLLCKLGINRKFNFCIHYTPLVLFLFFRIEEIIPYRARRFVHLKRLTTQKKVNNGWTLLIFLKKKIYRQFIYLYDVADYDFVGVKLLKPIVGQYNWSKKCKD
jgi:hypothetical protein